MVYNAEEAKATAIANGHAIIEDSLVGNELTLRTQPLYVHA